MQSAAIALATVMQSGPEAIAKISASLFRPDQELLIISEPP